MTSRRPTSKENSPLRGFEEGYPSYIRSWRDLIIAHLDSGGALPPATE